MSPFSIAVLAILLLSLYFIQKYISTRHERLLKIATQNLNNISNQASNLSDLDPTHHYLMLENYRQQYYTNFMTGVPYAYELQKRGIHSKLTQDFFLASETCQKALQI